MSSPIAKRSKGYFVLSEGGLHIIRMREEEKLSFKEIGARCGITGEWASRKYKDAKRAIIRNENALATLYTEARDDAISDMAPRVVPNEELIPFIDTVLLKLLSEMSTRDLTKMSFRDLSTAIGMFSEKKKLYQGEATEIIERRTIQELLPKIRDEIKRRGLDIEAVKTTYQEGQ